MLRGRNAPSTMSSHTMSGRQPTNEELGLAIRELRHGAGMTLEGLAAKAGMHTTYLSRIERAHSSPTWEKLVALARALGIPPSAIATAAEAQASRRAARG
jgi:transcriptional regulator with XRE-family HTH domain